MRELLKMGPTVRQTDQRIAPHTALSESLHARSRPLTAAAVGSPTAVPAAIAIGGLWSCERGRTIAMEILENSSKFKVFQKRDTAVVWNCIKVY